jgi:excisionase family DNA binding protein
LQVTPMTVYRMLHDGRLRGTKTGRRYKVFAPDVAELNQPKDLSKGDSA